MANAADRRLRILCLHGYRQNGVAFKTKLGAFRKLVKKYADLTFITAPLTVPQNVVIDNEEEITDALEQYGWWFSKENSFNAHDKTNLCKGFEQSLELLKCTFHKEGPFDGILGFSQGAALAAILCGLKEQDELTYDFKFAILIAAFKSNSSPHDDMLKKIGCPTLHVIGETDRIIPKEMSEELLAHFSNYEVIYHSGGHFTPTGKEQKARYVDFLNKMLSIPVL